MAGGEEVDILAEAEALGLGGDGMEEDLGGEDENRGEDLSGAAPEADAILSEPKFLVGQQVQVLKENGAFATCTVVAADKTEMGPMYAVKFQDGLVQSLVPEEDLSV
mmetsp:Transcript_126490/g.316222  ORF Transcript_126490/g.316222 Transcript_126490/m.316222 type:complete len:107 (+) Transcript_126490:78-398(+)